MELHRNHGKFDIFKSVTVIRALFLWSLFDFLKFSYVVFFISSTAFRIIFL